MSTIPSAGGSSIGLRRIRAHDLARIADFKYTASIVEPLDDLVLLTAAHASTGLWQHDAGALAVEDQATGRLLGTTQFYRSGACIHGYEIGYVIHDEADWGQGRGASALRLMTALLLAERPDCHRLQLIIETWNERSWRLAERAGFEREGVLRKAGYSSEIPEDCYVYSLTR
jgi:RimJ/RimL family protein N-acetyltransferase